MVDLDEAALFMSQQKTKCMSAKIQKLLSLNCYLIIECSKLEGKQLKGQTAELFANSAIFSGCTETDHPKEGHRQIVET